MWELERQQSCTQALRRLCESRKGLWTTTAKLPHSTVQLCESRSLLTQPLRAAKDGLESVKYVIFPDSPSYVALNLTAGKDTPPTFEELSCAKE